MAKKITLLSLAGPYFLGVVFDIPIPFSLQPILSLLPTVIVRSDARNRSFLQPRFARRRGRRIPILQRRFTTKYSITVFTPKDENLVSPESEVWRLRTQMTIFISDFISSAHPKG